MKLLTPVYWMSGFSMGAGLAAVDIDAKLARTLGWVLRHLAAATRFKLPNISADFSIRKRPKVKPKRVRHGKRNKVGQTGSEGGTGRSAARQRQALVTSQLEKRLIDRNLVRS